MKIDKRWKGHLNICLAELDGADLAENGEQIKLNELQTARVRYLVVQVLNVLESVLIAWKHGVTDGTIIEDEFRFIVKTKEDGFLLENFRAAVGKNKHPGIEAFTTYLKTKESKSSEIRPPVV